MEKRPGPIEIRFVSGFDRGPMYPLPPRFTRDAGLSHRFAVIQETYVEGEVDMIFDGSMWKAVVDYASRFCAGGVLTIAERSRDFGRREIPLASHMEAWERADPDYRYPPEVLFVRKGGALEFCVINEAWASVGGPRAYHDSHTYVLYSKRDLSDEIPEFLRAWPESANWDLKPVQPPAYEPSILQRMGDWLGRRARTAR